MITDTSRAVCSCHTTATGNRRPSFTRTDQMRRRPRIGSADPSSELTFEGWLQQQPADTQAAYYAYQAANPGSQVFNPDAPQSPSLFESVPRWLLIAVAAFAAWLVLQLAIPEGGRRRR